MKPRTDEVVRFWDKLDMTAGPDGCWPWMFGVNRDGYGQFWISKPERVVKAHRMAYALHVGIDIRDLDVEVVMHSCDNPPCCNPAHLRAATHADNIADRDQKGRGGSIDQRGENNSKAKLTENDVRSIRRRLHLGHTQSQVATDFGVRRQTIQAIAFGKTWSHVK